MIKTGRNFNQTCLLRSSALWTHGSGSLLNFMQILSFPKTLLRDSSSLHCFLGWYHIATTTKNPVFPRFSQTSFLGCGSTFYQVINRTRANFCFLAKFENNRLWLENTAWDRHPSENWFRLVNNFSTIRMEDSLSYFIDSFMQIWFNWIKPRRGDWWRRDYWNATFNCFEDADH